MVDFEEIREAVEHISPEQISSYPDWFRFSCAAKSAGLSLEEWDEVCRQAPGYDAIENAREWEYMKPSDGSDGVPAEYIYKLAYENGWRRSTKKDASAFHSNTHYTNREAEASATILAEKNSFDNVLTFDNPETSETIEKTQAVVTDKKSRAKMLVAWLLAVFNPDDVPNVHTNARANVTASGAVKYQPCDSGESTVTVKQIVDALNDSEDIEGVFGVAENNPAGVWFGVNPQSVGCNSKDTVTRYANALVESDDMPIPEQIEALLSLNLPIRALTMSGGKSVHAVVAIDAENAKEYASRVSELYRILSSAGFIVDEQNKNANRLTRAAGFMRGEQCQSLIATNIGPDSWGSWMDWRDDKAIDEEYGACVVADNLDDVDTNTEWLVGNILRRSELCIIAGQSKAGKSLIGMQMGLAIASGRPWMGHECKSEKVLYCNHEISDDMAINRRNGIARAMHLTAGDIRKFLLWNLAGRIKNVDNFIESMTKKVIREGVGVVFVDPVYILEGIAGVDENDATAVTQLIDKLLKMRATTGATVVIIHHISSKIRDMAGYSLDSLPQGSSTFSRIYDTLIALQELDIDDIPEAIKYAKKAFRISYSTRNSEAPENDYVWATFPAYTTAHNEVIKHAPLISSKTYENREKARQEALQTAIANATGSGGSWSDECESF